MPPDSPRIWAGFSEAFINGDLLPGYTKAAYGDSFKQARRSLPQVVDHLRSGKAWIPHRFKGSGRTNETFVSTEIFALDLESPHRDVSLADLGATEFGHQYAFFAQATRSSGVVSADHNPQGYKRSRGYFRASEVVEGVDRVRTLALAVQLAVGLPTDTASFKPAQPWFGSTNRIEDPHVNLDAPPFDVRWVAGYLTDVARAEMERDLAPKPARIKPTGTRAEAYATAAFDNEMSRLENTPEGERNNMLFRTSVQLYSYALGGWAGITQDLVTQRLETVAHSWSNPSKSLTTIWNGRKQAKATPLELPALLVKAKDTRWQAPVTVVTPTTSVRTEDVVYFHPAGFALEQYHAVFAAFPGNNSIPKLYMVVYTSAARGLIDPRNWTIKDLFAARDRLGTQLPSGTIRRLMETYGDLFSELLIEGKTLGKSENKSRRGRPEQHYALLALEEAERNLLQWAEHRFEEKRHLSRCTTPLPTQEMIDALDGESERVAREVLAQTIPAAKDTAISARLAREDFGKLARSLLNPHFVQIPLDCEDVRAAVLAAENDPDEAQSSPDLARQYGISRRTVPTLVKRASLEPVEQTVDCPITSAETFMSELRAARKKHCGFPRAIIEVKTSGVLVEHYFDLNPGRIDANKAVIKLALDVGSSVQIRLRTANKYRPANALMPTAVRKRQAAARIGQRKGDRRTSRYYGPGYNSAVVTHWLKVWLRQRGYSGLAGDRFINPATGEIFDLSPQNGLISFAATLGAVVRRLA